MLLLVFEVWVARDPAESLTTETVIAAIAIDDQHHEDVGHAGNPCADHRSATAAERLADSGTESSRGGIV